MTATGAEEAPRPLLRIVRGTPTAEELAAVVAVIAARGAGGEPATPAPRSRWASYAVGLRRPLHPGPDAWRSWR